MRTPKAMRWWRKPCNAARAQRRIVEVAGSPARAAPYCTLNCSFIVKKCALCAPRLALLPVYLHFHEEKVRVVCASARFPLPPGEGMRVRALTPCPLPPGERGSWFADADYNLRRPFRGFRKPRRSFAPARGARHLAA